MLDVQRLESRGGTLSGNIVTMTDKSGYQCHTVTDSMKCLSPGVGRQIFLLTIQTHKYESNKAVPLVGRSEGDESRPTVAGHALTDRDACVWPTHKPSRR